MLDLKGKVAFITGAGAIGAGWGNGKATAVLLARQGAKVFGTDINPAAVRKPAPSSPRKAASASPPPVT